MTTSDDVYVFVAEDPEREWALIAPHAAHDTREYASWIDGRRGGSFSLVDDFDQLRTEGNYRVWTPSECIVRARERGALVFKPLVGGLDPAVGWRSLQLFADKVLPHLRVPPRPRLEGCRHLVIENGPTFEGGRRRRGCAKVLSNINTCRSLVPHCTADAVLFWKRPRGRGG